MGNSNNFAFVTTDYEQFVMLLKNYSMDEIHVISDHPVLLTSVSSDIRDRFPSKEVLTLDQGILSQKRDATIVVVSKATPSLITNGFMNNVFGYANLIVLKNALNSF